MMIIIINIIIIYIIILLKNVNSYKNEVHTFFYLWYGNPEIDGKYQHWNHEVLPHWELRINSKYPEIGKHFQPESDLIHSSFYPMRNTYSSKCSNTLQSQFNDLHRAGITVIVISWWGQKDKDYATDTQGINTDLIMHDIFNAADKDGKIKVVLHLEPYPGRTAESVKSDVSYIIENYSNYTSFYRYNNNKPLFYVYDSYHISPHSWSSILSSDSENSIRGTNIDAIFLGLWLDHHHGKDLNDSGFDGIYTYFASDGFSYASTISNFNSISKYCKKNKLICNLSVGPGYNDTKIRPWNFSNTKARKNGQYYTHMFQKAIDAKPDIISITTFNEWGEGTQIEPAIPKYGYMDYGDDGSYKYIDLTRKYIDEFIKDEL